MSAVWTDIFLPLYQACLWFLSTQLEYGLSSNLWAIPVLYFTMDCIFQEWSIVWAQIIFCSVNKTWASLKGKGKGTWANLSGKGDHPQEQVAQRSCGVFILGDTQTLAWHLPEQPALANVDLSKAWTRWSPKISFHLNYSVRLSRSNSKM